MKRHHVQSSSNSGNRHNVKSSSPRPQASEPRRSRKLEASSKADRSSSSVEKTSPLRLSTLSPVKPPRRHKNLPLLLLLFATLIIAGVVWEQYAAAHRDLDASMERSRQLREERSRWDQERTRQILRKAGVLE